MKVSRSEYIAWAKSRERFRYSIGRSSIRPCPGELLAADLGDLVINGDNAHGWAPLREALGRRYGVSDRRVVLAIGASMANHLACAALLQRGDHVLVETPGYEPLHALPGLFGAQVEPFPRARAQRWKLDADAVAARLRPETRLVVLSDFHNPTGAEAGAEGLEALAELAERKNLHVVVDEVYREFVHRPGDPIAAHVSERFVSTCSLTKAYGLDGLRAGWIVAAEPLAARIRDLNDLYGIIMPHPSERLALRALSRIEVLHDDVAALLARNRPLVEAFIARRPELDWVPPAAGPVGFVRLAGGAVDQLVRTLERDHDATLTPGRFFGAPDHFRIGFGMSTDDLQAGLQCLGSALDTLPHPDQREDSP